MNPLVIALLIVGGAFAVVGLIAIGCVLLVQEEPPRPNVIDINSRRGK